MKTRGIAAGAAALTLAIVTGCLPAAQTDKEVPKKPAGEKAEKAAGLKVGDAAPKLQAGKWIQGDPVTAFEKGKVYVVEFWATWCGPCRATIPHLNEVYKKFKDRGLVVIGQNCWEEEEAGVPDFVKKMGEKMTYAVALDDKSQEPKGAMARTWMEAAGQNGIPAAMVVDKQGRIAWIGHPMAGLDGVVEQILDDRFDPKKAAVEREAEEARQAGMQEKMQAVLEDAQAEKWDGALEKLAKVRKGLSGEEALQLDMLRVQLLLGKKDTASAVRDVDALAKAAPDNEQLLNALAWMLVTHEAFAAKPDLERADRIATQADTAAKGANSAVLDTLARVKFMRGEKDKAIELQARAVEKADDADQKAELGKTLDSYKEGKLPPAE